MLSKKALEKLKENVVIANRIISSQQIDKYLGHVSARIPGTRSMLIKSFVLDLLKTDKKDIVTVDFDGNRIAGQGTPPVEACLHYEIYKAREDVASIVHSHPKWTTIFGIAGRKILPVYHAGICNVALDDIPVYKDGDLILFSEKARKVAKTLGQHAVCHLQNHGVIVVGTSIEEATLRSINLETQAELNYLAAQLGKVNFISKKVIQDFQKWQDEWIQKTGRGADITGWEYFKSLVY